MNRTILFCLSLMLCAAIVWTAALAVQPEAAQPETWGPVQRYVPDDRQPRPAPPRPDRQRTVYADRIILEGPDCRITLDATGRQPGIVLQHRRTGERALLYLSSRGKAVMGITTPARKELAAGLFAGDQKGLIQLGDRWGIHVLSGAELSRAAGKVGAKPK